MCCSINISLHRYKRAKNKTMRNRPRPKVLLKVCACYWPRKLSSTFLSYRPGRLEILLRFTLMDMMIQIPATRLSTCPSVYVVSLWSRLICSLLSSSSLFSSWKLTAVCVFCPTWWWEVPVCVCVYITVEEGFCKCVCVCVCVSVRAGPV